MEKLEETFNNSDDTSSFNCVYHLMNMLGEKLADHNHSLSEYYASIRASYTTLSDTEESIRIQNSHNLKAVVERVILNPNMRSGMLAALEEFFHGKTEEKEHYQVQFPASKLLNIALLNGIDDKGYHGFLKKFLCELPLSGPAIEERIKEEIYREGTRKTIRKEEKFAGLTDHSDLLGADNDSKKRRNGYYKEAQRCPVCKSNAYHTEEKCFFNPEGSQFRSARARRHRNSHIGRQIGNKIKFDYGRYDNADRRHQQFADPDMTEETPRDVGGKPTDELTRKASLALAQSEDGETVGSKRPIRTIFTRTALAKARREEKKTKHTE